MKRYRFLFGLFIFFHLAACNSLSHITVTDTYPPLYPDYSDVTLPVNIAPLNFMVTGATAVKAELLLEDESKTFRGRNKISIPMRTWRRLLQNSALLQKDIVVSVTAKIQGTWYQYLPFHWHVTTDSLDPYVSYRLIEPGYEVWNTIRLAERNVENFRERIIADNRQTDKRCMNCHTYGNQDPSLSFFHLRGPGGGTVLNREGKLRKLDLHTEELLSPAIYGNFHPSGRFAVFSTNLIVPGFHTKKGERLEVYDTASDLIVADFEENVIIPFPSDFPNEFRTFPVFSADGSYIYYCNAPQTTLPDSIFDVRYDLLRIRFNEQERTWGTKADTVFSASSHGVSVCHPKTSPDGRYLLFTAASYGTFPIWHQETDLWLLDLQEEETVIIDRLPGVNSNRSDTYHSWSSNSRWFVFASKRDDGMYGKPYFCYLDKEGKAHKPFVLPQKNPQKYRHTLVSYNLPELSTGKLPFGSSDIERLYRKTAAEKVY